MWNSLISDPTRELSRNWFRQGIFFNHPNKPCESYHLNSTKKLSNRRKHLCVTVATTLKSRPKLFWNYFRHFIREAEIIRENSDRMNGHRFAPFRLRTDASLAVRACLLLIRQMWLNFCRRTWWTITNPIRRKWRKVSSFSTLLHCWGFWKRCIIVISFMGTSNLTTF